MTTRLIVKVVECDITTLHVDAIVNAANESLLGGGGVDGAIHRAAGPELLVATRALGGCPTGDARTTPGFRLPARLVIHAVGPVYVDGLQGEPSLLAHAYWACLREAGLNSVSSLAFPAISAGAYGYPLPDAAEVAARTLRDNLDLAPNLTEVVFACPQGRTADAFRAALKNAEFDVPV